MPEDQPKLMHILSWQVTNFQEGDCYDRTIKDMLTQVTKYMHLYIWYYKLLYSRDVQIKFSII